MKNQKRRRWTERDKREVWLAANGRCAGCDRYFRLDQHGGTDGWTIDHVVPRSAPATDDARLNGQLMCRPCNQRKGNRLNSRDVRTSLGRMTQAVEKLVNQSSSGNRRNNSGSDSRRGRSGGGNRCRNCGNHTAPGYRYCRDCGCRWRGCRNMAAVNLLGVLLEYCDRHMDEKIHGPPQRWSFF